MRLVAIMLVALAGVAVAPARAAELPLVVDASVAHAVLFGDPVSVQVTVTANPDEVELSGIRITAPLVPMTQLGPIRVSRVSRGQVGTVSFVATAACMEQRCVAARGPRLVRLPPVHVAATTTDGRELEASATWPEIAVRGRVAATVRDSAGQFRTDLDPPPVTYRIAPDRATRVLLLAAEALALIAIALATVRTVRLVRRRNDVPLTELERALLLARQSERRPAADRRRAVGLLARVLAIRGAPLSEEASRLAWSAPEPAPGSVSTLVDDIGRAVGTR